MGGDIELSESVSMAMGGMLGSGVFATLGPVVLIAGPLAWVAVLVGGGLILCAAFSFVRLNDLTDDPESPLKFTGQFTGSSTLAGMAGWTFVIAYVGSSALYAYAFGIYFASIIGVESVLGLPLQSLITLLGLVGFVGLNMLGAQAAGLSQKLIVGVQILILAVFGVVGLYYGFAHDTIRSGLSQLSISPLIAAAIAVVGFEGWELLFFDQDEIADPEDTVRTAVYVSIGANIVLFGVIGIVVATLVSPQLVQQHAGTILVFVTQTFLGRLAVVIVGLAAILSTGSALNATLFSAARLLDRLVTEDLMPAELTSSSEVPLRPLLVIGVPVALLGLLGSLSAIASFASLAFIVLFGFTCYLAFGQRDSAMTAFVPGVGAVGSALGATGILYHLYTNNPGVFVIVLALSVAVIAAEILYFEHESLVEGTKEAEEKAEEAAEKAEERGKEAREKAEERGKEAREKAEEAGETAEGAE